MNPWAGARILIGLMVLALVMYGVWLLLGMFALPHPFPTLIVIVLLLVVLGWLWNGGGGPLFRP